MEQHYESAADFAADVVRNAKAGWVNGQFDVNGSVVGIKAHGKWVQRMNVHCLTDGGEFRTQKAMREFIIDMIGGTA